MCGTLKVHLRHTIRNRLIVIPAPLKTRYYLIMSVNI